MLKSLIFLPLTALLWSIPAQAAGGGIEFINYYKMIFHALGVYDEHTIHVWFPVMAGLLSFVLVTILGFKFRNHISNLDENITPDRRFNLGTFLEMLMEFIDGLVSGIIGEKTYRPYLALMSALFIFIFFSNLTGLVPGFPPATESLDTNLAMALSVFLVYNWAGIKEHGSGYVKQFTGPVLWLAPLMLIIELIGHLARPLSLSLRLYGNIFGDHLVLGVFTGLTYVIAPAALLFFGLLVASLQSFVFTLLSSIYVSMAVSHDH